MFVFSLKQPLFEVLKRDSLQAQELSDGSWQIYGLVGQAWTLYDRSFSTEP